MIGRKVRSDPRGLHRRNEFEEGNPKMQRFEKLIERFEALQYGEHVIDRLKSFQSKPDSIEIRLIDIRTLGAT